MVISGLCSSKAAVAEAGGLFEDDTIFRYFLRMPAELSERPLIITELIKIVSKGGWLVAGMVALAFGAVGAFLPVLPTTPFVILAAFCFGKSSPRLQSWLENTRLFGPMIADWREKGAIAPRYKIIAVAMMAVMFIGSFIYGASALVLALQALGMSLGAAYVLTRPN